MTKQTRSTNPQLLSGCEPSWRRSSFGLRHSFVLRHSPLLALASAYLVSLGLTGCAETNRVNDPLLGNGGRTTAAGQIPVPPPPVPSASLGMMPPAPSSPSSPAALASRPLDNGMRIGPDPTRDPNS